MISQARITSPTDATVHLGDRDEQLTAASLPELRSRVKQVFIEVARERKAPLDVVIVEADRLHHLRVEPSGRITSRTADDSPVHGPALDAPLTTPPAAASASAAADDAHDDTTRIRPVRDADAARRHRGAPFSPDAPVVPAPDAALADRATASPLAPTGPTGPVAVPSPDPGASAPTPPRERPVDVDETVVSDQAAFGAGATDAPASIEPFPAGPVPGAASPSPAPQPAPVAPVAPAPIASAPVEPAPRPRVPAGPPAGAVPAGPAPVGNAPAGAASVGAAPAGAAGLPTLEDLRAASAPRKVAPATRGLRGAIRRLTGGLISPGPGREERAERDETQRVRRELAGPRNIVVVNLKGGAHKTTASLMIASTLGVARGGSVLAWDNNETRGTLGWRGVQGTHHRTALDLLHDLDGLADSGTSVTDIDRYVRHQGETRFDILASDEDAGSAASMDGDAFARLNETLSRFYRLKVIDTGNNVRASNWLAAVGAADQLVIISTVREDTFNAAAWMIDELRATGYAAKVDSAVTILSHSSTQKIDPVLHKRLLQHFGAHTRAVHEVPFEKQFIDGGELDWSRLSPETTRAWLRATASIVDGL